ncbi:preprotein translocase subunit YajC [Actinomycetaceae bacterium WB03_NA08]|uniref:Preprotein translocase subunit YajC n=1 Tax=Scrofimicrobium canadense TaxID=2652290 RepID=A0A6N7VP48_9ACTO|nr:preprotein translocase subunit YajC [Scrofimicrobium canadense]MSS83504.1 preprotein translocase subunit YajC [Scrofimicrobium canadense]
MELYILMGLMLVAFIGLNMWSKKSQRKRQEEHDRMMKEQLVPGAWVHTRVGFFGRFVDLDGDVLILETPSGEETYWDKRMLASVGDLPFANDEEENDDIPEAEQITEIDEIVEETNDSSDNASDTDLDGKN